MKGQHVPRGKLWCILTFNKMKRNFQFPSKTPKHPSCWDQAQKNNSVPLNPVLSKCVLVLRKLPFLFVKGRPNHRICSPKPRRHPRPLLNVLKPIVPLRSVRSIPTTVNAVLLPARRTPAECVEPRMPGIRLGRHSATATSLCP